MKIGIDIGGSHIGIATVNEEGKIIEKIEQDIKKQENMESYIVDYVDSCIAKLMQTANITEIGIAAPGNPKNNVITNLVNLGLDKIDFQKIEQKYQIPMKSMNDAKAAAIAEKQYGALKNSKDNVFLCLGTGIGGAVFLNNKLLQANRNPGFELGHMIIDKNGTPCHCGKRGCFETYCSMRRLKDKLKIMLEKFEEENAKKVNTSKANLDNTKINLEDAKMLKQTLQKYKNEPEIKEVLQEYIDNLVIGLSNIIDIFEPEVICLGGSFVHFKDELYFKLIEEMEERRYVFNKEILPKIALAELGNDAGIIGATLL